MASQPTRGSLLRGALAGFSGAADTAVSQPDNFASRVSRIGLGMVLCLIVPTLAAAQNPPSGRQPGPDAQKCAALAELNLEGVPGGPAVITSARLVDVPASGLEQSIFAPSGFASSAAQSTSRIHQYCDVTGYVAPQNKFELRLPLPADWNQKFFFFACGGFCGAIVGTRCNRGLARGYASVTGNGGHDSALGFDGIWAANAPNVQEDFGWRSNHVVTLVDRKSTRLNSSHIQKSRMPSSA